MAHMHNTLAYRHSPHPAVVRRNPEDETNEEKRRRLGINNLKKRGDMRTVVSGRERTDKKNSHNNGVTNE